MCIRQDSSLWSWGDNQAGQLGIGTNGSTYDKKIPTKVDSIESVQRVVCGLLQCAAITYDSTLFTWGRNLNGQLGNGTTLINNYPKQNLISKAILDVSTGGGHTLVRTFDSTLYSFGANDIGQLGIGSPVLYSATPIIVNDPCFITTSINNTVAQVKFEIYPNPTKDLVRIASTSGKIEIYNNIGVLINEFEVGNGIKSISMNNLPSGLYVFKYSYGTFVKSQLLILL
jgi:alpha-tubulin suppressor-like RCC1 family protein